jgi:hypothetical protein
MHRKDLDKNMEGGRDRSDMPDSDIGSSRNRMGGGSRNDRTRNREDIGRDVSESDMDADVESDDDLQRKQREGNLGNERVRGVGE